MANHELKLGRETASEQLVSAAKLAKGRIEIKLPNGSATSISASNLKLITQQPHD